MSDSSYAPIWLNESTRLTWICSHMHWVSFSHETQWEKLNESVSYGWMSQHQWLHVPMSETLCVHTTVWVNPTHMNELMSQWDALSHTYPTHMTFKPHPTPPPLTEESDLKYLELQSVQFPCTINEWWEKTCLKIWGLPWKLVWNLQGLLWKMMKLWQS